MNTKGDGRTVVAVGVAACAACCAGPILGFLAALGVGTVAGFAVFGALGLAVAVTVGGLLYLRRRRGATRECAPSEQAVPVQLQTAKPPSFDSSGVG